MRLTERAKYLWKRANLLRELNEIGGGGRSGGSVVPPGWQRHGGA